MRPSKAPKELATATYQAVLATEDLEWARELTTAMAPAEDIRILRILDRDTLPEFVASGAMAVVLLDVSSAEIVSAWQKAAESATHLSVLAFGDPDKPELLRSALRLGATDYLSKSATLREISEGIYQGGERLARKTVSQNAAPSAHGKIIAVVSPRGGAGRSTIAASTAVALEQRLRRPVSFWDLNLSLSVVDALFGVKPPRPLADMMKQLGHLDSEFFLTFFAPHKSGVHVLATSPSDESEALEIQLANMHVILDAFRSAFAFTLVDTSASFTETDFAAVESADLVLVVMTPDILSLKASTVYLEEMETHRVVRSKHVLVLNGFGREAGDLTRRHVEETLALPVWARIPFDRRLCLKALNLGEPAVLEAPRSGVARAFRKLAERIVGMGAVGP